MPTTKVSNRIAIHRSFFRDVYGPLMSTEGLSVSAIAQLRYGSHQYPLLCVESGRRGTGSHDRPRVLISAGVHGDEPAGVVAAVDFLCKVAPALTDRFRFVVFPCVNPSGYEANTLETMNGVNLNRSFGVDATEDEIAAIESWLNHGDRWFRATLDLHEAPPYYCGEGFDQKDNPTGTYLYETVSDHSLRIGHAMIAALPEGVEVCRWPTIYQDTNDGGVIAYPGACHNPFYAEKTSFDAYLNGPYTSHSFTTEIPTFWGFEKRVQTHLTYLRSALQLIGDEEPASVTPSARPGASVRSRGRGSYG